MPSVAHPFGGSGFSPGFALGVTTVRPIIGLCKNKSSAEFQLERSGGLSNNDVPILAKPTALITSACFRYVVLPPFRTSAGPRTKCHPRRREPGPAGRHGENQSRSNPRRSEARLLRTPRRWGSPENRNLQPRRTAPESYSGFGFE